jgi:hypothetical protein
MRSVVKASPLGSRAIRLRRTLHSRVTLPSPLALSQGSVVEFQEKAFGPQLPATFPSGQFLCLPAIKKWFRGDPSTGDAAILDRGYLQQFSEAVLPLELTRRSSSPNGDSFERFDAPFALFLDWVERSNSPSSETLYLAQASLRDLPEILRADLPSPDLISESGKGDVYDANIWMGLPPTYTPLHRDPNPNLFVQLAGTKLVRMFPPRIGLEIFKEVQKRLGSHGSSAFRGYEMMQGPEKSLLEQEVWNRIRSGPEDQISGYEVQLNAGDGLFIPTGWWHSIKGIGNCITGSVSGFRYK